MLNDVKARNKNIIQYNIAGVIVNLLLCLSKIIVGTAIHSHAVILDGVNSLSDMLSYGLTIFSTILGNKKADKARPFGFGRMEYVCSMVVTLIIIFVGGESIFDAVDALINPHEAPEYNTVVIVVMCFSLTAKIIYGLIMRKKGKELKADSMVMAGSESMGDALLSISILAAIVVYNLTGVDIEHYLCIAISVMIIFTGVRVARECMIKILGGRIDPEVRKKITQLCINEPEVLNVSNMILHNYGENVYVGSVDIEVDENMPAAQVCSLTRKLIHKAEKEGIQITSIGISSANLSNPEAAKVWDAILEIVRKYKSILRAQSFSVDFAEKLCSFYIIQDYGNKNREQEKKQFHDELKKQFPDMIIHVYNSIDV